MVSEMQKVHKLRDHVFIVTFCILFMTILYFFYRPSSYYVYQIDQRVQELEDCMKYMLPPEIRYQINTEGRYKK